MGLGGFEFSISEKNSEIPPSHAFSKLLKRENFPKARILTKLDYKPIFLNKYYPLLFKVNG
jgi:hypothetical protein